MQTSDPRPIAVELQHVCKQFPESDGSVVTAVDNVSLQIYDGEFFSLLGPSGCGKTTTLRMIAGLDLPTTGSVLIQNREMAQEPAHRRPVNTVFQRYALFPHMNVRENVAFGLRMKKVPKRETEERVDQVLQLVRLENMGRRRPGQLSGGQQQRVALARALVNNPAVLLLDEPLGALDLKLRQAMQEELKRIQQSVGITFIYVTHDQEEALTMSDRIAVMNDGHVLQVDQPYNIYEEPKTRFVADFIGETNFINGTLEGHEGEVSYVRLPNDLVTSVETAENRISAGTPVTVAVRPEKIFVHDGTFNGVETETNGANSFTGTVREIVYIGTDTYYDVMLPGDIQVTARRQNQDYTGTAAVLSVGDTAHVAWHAHNASLLTE